MNIISEKKLKEFWQKYPDAEPGIRAWIKLTKKQEWNNFIELKDNSLFAPDQVKNFVIFDIGGNKYRLITRVNYKTKKVFIRDVLTHTEYNTNKWKKDEWFDS